jgi:hypothetical protein
MSNFDPTASVVFDLDGGKVSLVRGSAQVMLPAAALGDLCSSLDAEAVRRFGSQLGAQAGARIADRLGAERPSMQVMVDHLGGELSLSGLGSFSIERWGKALVARVRGCPLGQGSGPVLSAYLERALLAALGRELSALLVEDNDDSIRFFLCSSAAARRVRGWLAEGKSWGDALVLLHATPGGVA